MEQCKEKKTRIEIKKTKDEFMARIRFLLGPTTDQASTVWYEYLINKYYSISVLNFEIKKKWIYERKYKAKVLVIHAILLQREVIDRMMRNFVIEDGT